MKLNTNTVLVTAFAVVLALSSCKKQAGPSGTDGAQGPAGPVLTGNLKGYISHYDLSGNKLLSGLAGDTIKIDGIGAMAITDVNGMYAFNSITTGNYNLSINRAGFGNTKIQNISFTGGGNDLYRNANISKIPIANVNALVATPTVVTTNSVAVNNINIAGTITPQPFIQTVIVFVSNPGASSTSALSGNNSNYYTVNVNANASIFSKNIATFEFYNLNFASGNTVYFAAYMIGANTNASSYVDFTNNRTVFTAISALPTIANVVLQ